MEAYWFDLRGKIRSAILNQLLNYVINSGKQSRCFFFPQVNALCFFTFFLFIFSVTMALRLKGTVAGSVRQIPDVEQIGLHLSAGMCFWSYSTSSNTSSGWGGGGTVARRHLEQLK